MDRGLASGFNIVSRHSKDEVNLYTKSSMLGISVSAMLPPIAYLTRLEKFMIGAAILVFAGLAAAVAVTYITRAI